MDDLGEGAVPGQRGNAARRCTRVHALSACRTACRMADALPLPHVVAVVTRLLRARCVLLWCSALIGGGRCMVVHVYHGFGQSHVAAAACARHALLLALRFGCCGCALLHY